MNDVQIYLDMDGVLADFDKHAFNLIGMPSREFEKIHGDESFWTTLWERDPDFYLNLPKMEGADLLVDCVKMLSPKLPKILTGCPKEEKSKAQKIEWARIRYPELDVITTKSRTKWHYCRPGDVLIDDYEKYIGLWRAAGGKFILHIDPFVSLQELEEYLHNRITPAPVRPVYPQD